MGAAAAFLGAGVAVTGGGAEMTQLLSHANQRILGQSIELQNLIHLHTILQRQAEDGVTRFDDVHDRAIGARQRRGRGRRIHHR